MGWEERDVIYISIHICRTTQQSAVIVRPLAIPLRRATVLDVYRVGHIPRIVVQQRRRLHPIPNPFCPFAVCLVVGVSRESCRQLKQTPVGNGVLHVVAGFVCKDLPTQSSMACAAIPAIYLCVEDALCQGQPGVATFDIGIFQFGGGNSG